MSKRIIRDEMLKANAELGTAIDLLTPSSVRQTRNKLRSVHRRTRRVLNLLKRRSKEGTTISSNPQAPPVSAPVSGVLDPVRIVPVDWVRLRQGIHKGAYSYGQIARAIGKGTKGRAAVHLVVSRKTKSGPVYDLVCRWAAAEGYLLNPKSRIHNPKSSITRGRQ